MRRWTKRLIACATLLFAAVPAWALSPFFVFFDTGSARLTPAAEAVLDNAAAAIRTADVREIEIMGATDRVGSDVANLALSRRRAEVVRDALLARGMSRHVRVRLTAAGETRPLVETADGVGEAQNRNAAVVLVSMCVGWPQPGRRTDGECATPLPD
jgi:outer membrane protein OmpA-like peptidoglycan-associated protein